MRRKEIILEPVSGQDISSCFREAARTCIDELCRVSFVHNDHKFSIDQVDIAKSFKGYDEWNKSLKGRA
jgi:hypothetical protein